MPEDRRKRFGQVAVVIVAVIAIATVTWFFALRDDAYAWKGGFYDPGKVAPALSLTDQDGQPFDLADHRGKAILLYFGYTYCPDYCPATLVDMQAVLDELGDKAADVEVVMVTIDPARDTPARLKEYLAFYNPGFIGLSGDLATTQQVSITYGIGAIKRDVPGAPNDYLMDHSTQLYAIAPNGNLRLTWAFGTDPADIASDVDHMLTEDDAS